MNKAFYAEYAQLEERHWWFTGRNRILNRLLSRHSMINGNQSLLNVGCGTGGFLRFYKNKGRSIGLDIERDALDYCLDRGLRDLVQGDAPDLPFRTESFDLIMALDVLEHLEDHSAALSEFRRICAMGGHLLITVPAFNFLWGDQDLISHHRRRYTLRSLRTLVEQAGFSINRITYFNTLLFPIIASVRFWRKIESSIAPRELRSDFTLTSPGALNKVLSRVFASEAALLDRCAFPFGVSILVLATKPERPPAIPIRRRKTQ
jgi:SAM-dependent methyltransferase